MSLKLIVQASFLGIFGSNAYATTIIDIDVPDKDDNKSFSAEIKDTQKTRYSTTDPDKTTFEDIEMLENARGCKLVFAEKAKKNANYTVREWFNKKMKSEPNKSWRSAFACGVYLYKHKCEKGEVLTLEPKPPYGYMEPKVKF